MPELAEIKIASDFFNAKALNKKLKKIVPKATSKVKTDLSFVSPATIRAEARGKELIFTLIEDDGTVRKLLLFFGMSGYFKTVKTDEEEKKSRLTFYYEDGTIVGFFDGRNFSKWKWVETWSSNRGPCPVTEYKKFRANIMDNIDNKAFEKPVHVVLLNQKYFNGIGNYLRSTIIYNLRLVNPDTPFNQLTDEELDALLVSCRIIPAFFYFHHAYGLTAYNSGGKIYSKGYTKDEIVAWDEMMTFFDTYKNFKWMEEDTLLLDLISSSSPNAIMFYGEGCSKKDSTGRTFWYDCKWDHPGKVLPTYRTI